MEIGVFVAFCYQYQKYSERQDGTEDNHIAFGEETKSFGSEIKIFIVRKLYVEITSWLLKFRPLMYKPHFVQTYKDDIEPITGCTNKAN